MAFSEKLTMAVANVAPRGVERLIRGMAANDTLQGWVEAATRRTLRRVKKLKRIAVVSDTNIGDAVVLQGACSTFKKWLPDCGIDFFYQRKAHPLICANPFIDGHHPVFTDADFTSATNRRAVQAAIGERDYDLILNLYPFLANSELAGAGCPVLVPSGLIMEIVQAEKKADAIPHVAYQVRRYVGGIARYLTGANDLVPPDIEQVENTMFLDADVPNRARTFLQSAGVGDASKLAFLNPDSSSRFSRIPLQIQVDLIRGLLTIGDYDRILLGPAYSFVEVPDEIYAQFTNHPLSWKLIKLPRGIPIDTYAGIIDRADLFITSDTAQMHMAAAKRVTRESRNSFRNRTAVLSIFGATNSRIYGYDSFLPGYMDSSQDAAAQVFEGAPRCKNLTCIHKTRKNCRTVECFNGLKAAGVLEWIERQNDLASIQSGTESADRKARVS